MKYTFFIIICIVSQIGFCQTPAEINKAIGLPDSLTYENEIRIYKYFGYTNRRDVFRLYSENDTIKVDYYYYSTILYGDNKRFQKNDVITKKDMHFIWADVMNTYIDDIPDQKEIRYKLQTKYKVVLERGEYAYRTMSTAISDGESYYIFVKFGNKKNALEYHNPEAYLELYPGIDELESVVGLINIIRDNFNIWKE